MICQETQAFIHAYVDGELDLLRSLDIEKHIADCEACAQQYRTERGLQQAFRAAPLRFTTPQGLQKRILSSLGGRAKAAKTRRPFAGSPGWNWAGVAAGVAVALVIGWTLSRISRGPSSDDLLAEEVVSSHVRSLMANHLADVPSSDQHTVKPWFNGKLDFSPPVKDLASAGFPLVGGRLDYLDGRPVAALVYQRRKHFINLFIWPSTGVSGQKTIMRQGYNLLHWSSSGMTYWAVSDLNAGELQEFAQSVRN